MVCRFGGLHPLDPRQADRASRLRCTLGTGYAAPLFREIHVVFLLPKVRQGRPPGDQGAGSTAFRLRSGRCVQEARENLYGRKTNCSRLILDNDTP